MKTKFILSTLIALTISMASIAQRGAHKKDWDPEKMIEMKVEKFSKEQKLTEAQKVALKTSLQAHHTEMKAEREAEQERKKQMREKHQQLKHEKVKQALNDEELSNAWIQFEQKERAQMKAKHENHKKGHHKGERKGYDKQTK